MTYFSARGYIASAVRRVLLSTGLVGVTALTTSGQSPELDSVLPLGAQRGATVTLAFEGERLDRVTEILWRDPGLELVSWKATDEDHAEARVAVAADCDLGPHLYWLVGPHGVSEAATLSIGPYPVVEEVEPNDAIRDASRHEKGITIRGLVGEADIDSFHFELVEGDRLSIEVEAMRLGGSFFDAYVEVVGPDGETVASCDDTPLTNQDPVLSLVAKQSGAHTVRVREAAFGGGYETRYRLHVGSFNRPLVLYPAGGAPGETNDFTLLGAAGGPTRRRFTIPGDSPADCLLRIGRDEITPVKLRATGLANQLEAEPNNSQETATDCEAAPLALNGVLETSGDIDWFAWEAAAAGETYVVEAFGARIGSPIDTVIGIYGPSGRLLVRSDDNGAVHDSRTRFRTAEAGTHWVRVEDHLGRGGETFVYRVEIAPPEPKLALNLPVANPVRPQEGQSIVVPRGGRVAALIAARRAGFSGEVRIEATGLPPGVQVDSEAVAANEHLAPFVFEAARDAELGGGLVGFTGYGQSESGTVVGGLRREVTLVTGEPRQTAYHTMELQSTPLVVVESAPFDLRVEAPKAPLSQDGVVDVRVLVDRAEGFTAPIELDALMLPSRVERSEDKIVIPAGASEANFPLIAGPEATAGDHRLVITGEARVAGGKMRLATRPFPVRIVPPHAAIEIAEASTEQGSRVFLDCRVDWSRLAEGAASARLLGLPLNTTAEEVKLQPGQEELRFEVAVGEEAPASLHNTLFVELAVPDSGGVVREFLGRVGTLEVFPRGGAARDTASRLEQLRRQSRVASRRND